MLSDRHAKNAKRKRAGHFSPFNNFNILKCSAKVELEIKNKILKQLR